LRRRACNGNRRANHFIVNSISPRNGKLSWYFDAEVAGAMPAYIKKWISIMRITPRRALALGCVGGLILVAPAAAQPIPTPRPQQAAQSNAAQHRVADAKPKVDAKKRATHEDRSNRLVSMPVTREPKRPASGWPALVSDARKYMGTNPTDRKRLWCATFMNMVLAKTGYKGTNSDAAKSFVEYGRRISQPKVGAIAVLTRGKSGGHVGVVSGIDPNGNPIIISGNHGHRVGEAIYPRARVIAYVMPSQDRSSPTEVAAQGPTSRPAADGGLDSPIAELLAAIEAEQSRAERPRQPAAQPAATNLTAPQRSPQRQRELRVQQRADNGLAGMLGLPL
jgi:uncharacterized protein (TIGR02594 family)